MLEGDTEVPLTAQTLLPVRAGDVTLLLGPKSFFQTNTVVAGRSTAGPRVGRTPTRRRLGPLLRGRRASPCTPPARAARWSASRPPPKRSTPPEPRPHATRMPWARHPRERSPSWSGTPRRCPRPPPGPRGRQPAPARHRARARRLARGVGATHVVYSSCNVDTLARDLAGCRRCARSTAGSSTCSRRRRTRGDGAARAPLSRPEREPRGVGVDPSPQSSRCTQGSPGA